MIMMILINDVKLSLRGGFPILGEPDSNFEADRFLDAVRSIDQHGRFPISVRTAWDTMIGVEDDE